MCCLTAHNPGALGSTGPGHCSSPSSLFFQLSNTLSGSSAEVTQFFRKPSCPSFLWSAINSFNSRKTPPRDIGVVSPSPSARAGWVSLSLNLHVQSYSQGAPRRPKAMQIPNRKPGVPCYFFSSHLSTCYFLTGSVSEALTETKERHNQCSCWQHPVPGPSRSQPYQWM